MKLSGAALLVGAMVANVLSSDREYILISDLQTFSNAYCYCRQQKMTLATFRDETDLGLAASLCPNCTVWIGLYNLFTWYWINSDPYRFQKWGPGPTTTGPCAVMKNGLWYRENCQQRYPFVCYTGPTGALPLSLMFHLSCPSTPIRLASGTFFPQATRAGPAFKPNQGAIGVLPPSLQNPSLTLKDQQTTHVVPSLDAGEGRQSEFPGDGEDSSHLPFTSEVQTTPRSFQNNPTAINIQKTLQTSGHQPELPSSREVPSGLPFTSAVQATPRSFQSDPTATNIQQTFHNTGLPTQDRGPLVIQENRTWFEALSACRARDQLLAGRVALQRDVKAWLGLHRHGLWGYWAWADGSRVEEPQNWAEGEPNDPIWGNCGAGTGTGEGVIWEDECCEHKLYYVCE